MPSMRQRRLTGPGSAQQREQRSLARVRSEPEREPGVAEQVELNQQRRPLPGRKSRQRTGEFARAGRTAATNDREHRPLAHCFSSPVASQVTSRYAGAVGYRGA